MPPQLFKREIVRPRFRHCLDRNRAPLPAPAPYRMMVGGVASAVVIAWAEIATNWWTGTPALACRCWKLIHVQIDLRVF